MELKRNSLPRALSAKYTEDFAYPTIRDRLPVILTKVVDTLFRKKKNIEECFGKEGAEDLKIIIGEYSRLKNEIQTDKPFVHLTDSLEDVQEWNSCLDADKYEVFEDFSELSDEHDRENESIDKIVTNISKVGDEKWIEDINPMNITNIEESVKVKEEIGLIFNGEQTYNKAEVCSEKDNKKTDVLKNKYVGNNEVMLDLDSINDNMRNEKKNGHLNSSSEARITTSIPFEEVNTFPSKSKCSFYTGKNGDKVCNGHDNNSNVMKNEMNLQNRLSNNLVNNMEEKSNEELKNGFINEIISPKDHLKRTTSEHIYGVETSKNENVIEDNLRSRYSEIIPKGMYNELFSQIDINNSARVDQKKTSGLKQRKKSSWFNSSWLLAECYFYRRIVSELSKSKHLRTLDPFESLKRSALTESLKSASHLATYLFDIYTKDIDNRFIFNDINDIVESKKSESNSQIFIDEDDVIFKNLLYVSLWGNRCDLSLSACQENHHNKNLLNDLDHLRSFLLIDETSLIWNHLTNIIHQNLFDKTNINKNDQKSGNINSIKNVRIDIILDNSGFELYTDLCLADFLTRKLGKSGLIIYFHGKKMPWFVSDVTPNDWNWTFQDLTKSNDNSELHTSNNVTTDIPSCISHHLKKLALNWNRFVSSGYWVFKVDSFWTLPHDFSKMSLIAPSLYADLSHSNLLIFKGDLNYRKLVGDLKWDSIIVDLRQALRGFLPAALCTLRTLKSDVVVGLEFKRIQQAMSVDKENWMLNGSFGVINFVDKI